MVDDENPGLDAPFMEAVGRLGPALLGAFSAFEALQRRLHPADFPQLREALIPPATRLAAALEEVVSL